MTPDFLFGVSQFTTNPWTFEQDIEAYARLGVQAIEVCEFKLSGDTWQQQMALPAAHGLAITSIQPIVRTLFPSLSQPVPQDIESRMTRFSQSIERLAPYAPGTTFVTNTGIAPNGNIQEVMETAVREYRHLADFAAGHGARIALEPLNASIANIESAIWTVAQAMEIIEAVDRDNFGLCLDCWNVWQNANLDTAIRHAGPKIFVVQVSDWRTPRSFLDRLIPGDGEIPLAAFLKSVRDAGFKGAYSVEIFSSGVLEALWEADLEGVIRRSRAGLELAWHEALGSG
jgi:sugar phosphate isomerase/epimerase